MTLTMPTDPDVKDIRSLQALSCWLITLCVLVFVIVVVGGATRLTESGLSIPYWEPVKGALPPLSATDWMSEFQRYQDSPQYQQVNAGMTLAEFKAIFWWEWGHRQLGRLIGFAFLLPFLWLWIWHRAVVVRYRWRLVTLFALGALQGLIGWWMVASGLVREPAVSHYRLAVHLGNALLIFAIVLWTWMDVRAQLRPLVRQDTPNRRGALLLMVMLGVQILLGAFVAGKDAGLASNSWPLMDGALVPRGLFLLKPAWLNFFENDVMLHWLHRNFAWLVAGHALAMGLRQRRSSEVQVRFVGWALVATVCVQFLLGIAVVLNGVPVLLGAAHQGNAVLLLAAAVAFTHQQWTSGKRI